MPDLLTLGSDSSTCPWPSGGRRVVAAGINEDGADDAAPSSWKRSKVTFPDSSASLSTAHEYTRLPFVRFTCPLDFIFRPLIVTQVPGPT